MLPRMEKSMALLHSLLFLQFCFCFLPSAIAISPGNGEGYTINGRIKVEGFIGAVQILLSGGFCCILQGNMETFNKASFNDLIATSSLAMGAKGLSLPGKSTNTKIILNGGQRVTFIRPDGYFSFHNVPAGTHLIEVAAVGYFFSPVRVDVSARNPGKVQAALTENRRTLSELVLEPLREEQYYDKREPFSPMALLKSPMGLMMGFMLIVVFLMPKLMENMDPEEIKRAQEEMRSQGVPSLSNLLPRS